MQKFDIKTIGLLTTFEQITKARVKNLMHDKQQITFIVQQGDAGKAIGRYGSKIKRLSFLMKKKVKVIEFDPDKKEFIKNCIAPLKVDSVEESEGKLILHAKSREIRAQLIGRNRENLKTFKDIVNMYFNVEVSVAE
ncbi:MAG: NusA-like transcription termination signal-binding factor [Nanoarchaeota archaeon]